MSILVDQDSRILVQGITGKEGLFHAQQMLTFGTKVVAGATPGKGGEWVLDGKVPVFDSVRMGVEVTGADTSVIFVPAKHAMDAIFEAEEAGISVIICITEGIPIHDMMRVRSYLDNSQTRLIGPNSPGVLSPKQAKAGIIPGNIAIQGNVGVVSRSGTLTYEIVYALKHLGLGISTCVGIGGDPVIGTSFTDILETFEADPFTEKVIMIGEIGGTEEEVAAEFIASQMTKPVYAYIAGETAPGDKRMGHAGAIIEYGIGSASTKTESLHDAGVIIAHHPEEIPQMIMKSLGLVNADIDQ